MSEGVKILIPTALRPQVEDQETIAATGSSVREVLGSLTSRYPELGKRLFSEQQEINRFINVYVNDEDIRFLEDLDTALKPGDELSLVPAIAGG